MEFKLPSLGEDVEEGQVVELYVSQGDEVEKDQPLLALESDKATLDVPAPAAGKITKLHVSDGDTLAVGQLIATIEESAETADEAGEEEAAEAKEEEETEAKERQKAETEQREAEEPKEEAEDAKAESTEKEEAEAKEEKPAPATKAGKEKREPEKEEKKQKAAEKKREQEQPVEAEAEEEAPEKEEAEAAQPPTTGRVPVFAAPSVRQFAREIGVDITAVPGSGPGGRINVDDVKRLARESRTGGTGGGGNGRAAPAAPAQPVTLPDFSQWGEIEREDFTQIRRKTAQHMALCWSTIPHVTLFEKADATDLESRRSALKDRVEKDAAEQGGDSNDGATLTITAVLLKLTAAALDAHPKLRASIDVANQQTIHKRYCHIGVAVDTPRGLVVPVIRDVDRKGLVELSQELADVAGRARDGKLTMDDLTGGVFTLTNLGGLGTGYFTPIVNHPQSAILGVGRAATEPVYDDDAGEFKPRLMMPLSLSFDHRLIDGADGARFLHWFAQAVENPLMLAMES